MRRALTIIATAVVLFTLRHRLNRLWVSLGGDDSWQFVEEPPEVST